MLTHLVKGHFHLPAPCIPGDDLHGIQGGVGAQQCLWLELLLRVADQHPTQCQGWFATVIPDGRVSGDFKLSRLVALVTDLALVPAFGNFAVMSIVGSSIPLRHRYAVP